MDPKELHRRTVSDFAARVDEAGAVGDEMWSEATPCDEWDVRALLNHVTYEDLWTAPLLAGRTVADVGTVLDGDLLGDDPVGSFAAAGTQAADASAPIDLEQIVHLSFGDLTAGEYLNQIAAEHLIHAWDLAAATGGDRNFDEDVVEAVTDWFIDREAIYRRGGAVGPRVPTVSDSSMDRLLSAFGRDPSWHPHD